MKSWGMRRRTANLVLDDFKMRDVAAGHPSEGQILARTLFISLDPYLTRAMKSWEGEVPGWADGAVHGRLIAEVVESRAFGLAPGDRILAVGRWQELNVMTASDVELIPPDIYPPSLVLGVLGRSGITAWVGLHLAEPKTGETLLVSAASGPVGSVVGQLAKRRGCRVVGTAGGPEKCAYVVEMLGFDACIDHRDPRMETALAEAAPDGADILFENVGGPSLDPALPLMNDRGRIMLCGLAAHYLSEDALTLRNFKMLLYRQLTLRAFVTAAYPQLFAPALDELRAGVKSGDIHYAETITHGLERAPAAFLAMLEGEGTGKRLIRLMT